MKKVLSALHKAHAEKHGEALFSGLLTEVFSAMPAPPPHRRKALRSKQHRYKPGAADGTSTLQRHPPLAEYLVAFHHTTSPATEQYRKLHMEIVRAGRTRRLQTLLITSALAGEGKTTTALNLAISMAASGGEREVLLVETDFRRPDLQQCLGTSAEIGLADYLLGDIETSRLFVTTPIPGLTVVPMGKCVENPAALVTSRKMEQFFQAVAVQERYRYILLDSSPLLLTSETEALTLYADAVILVVRAGQTPREMIVKAIDMVGAECILGCVFNSLTAVDAHALCYYYRIEYFTQRP